jgi:CarD family transcriptional regulator
MVKSKSVNAKRGASSKNVRPVKATAKKHPPAKATAKLPARAAARKPVPAKAAPKPAPAKAVAGHAPAKPAAKVVPVKVPAKPTKPFSVKKLGDFAVGDYVVYPTHGVGKIEAIEEQDIAGFTLRLYVVRFEKEKMTLRVPVNKAEDSGLRKLSTRQQIDVALSTLKGRSRVSRAMWSRRAQEYEAKINSGDPVSIAEVVRDLHRNAGQPDQSYSERQIYEAALERLARELAAVERIDSDAAAVKLEQFLVKAA